jgi:hypothetical protein
MLVRASCFLLCILGMTQAGLTQAQKTQVIPKEILGTWVIARELPTKTISCWGRQEAKKIVGTEIQYSDKLFRWDQTSLENPVFQARAVTAQQFHDENSGAGPDNSEVTLLDLGINNESVTEIEIKHPPSHVFTETTEIPGDDVIVKDSGAIVFSVCNVYFEAKRVHNKK